MPQLKQIAKYQKLAKLGKIDLMPKDLKILLVIPFFYPHRGGSQKYAEEILARIKIKHPNTHIDVLCYNTDNAAAFEKYRGFNVYRVPCWNIIPARFALAKPFALLKMLKNLANHDYDYVNTHIRFFDPTWWVWLYARLIGAKSFFTGHVAVHPLHQKKLVEFVAVLTDLTVARISLKFYDVITYTNKTAQKFFNKTLWVHKKTFVVYGGVDTDFFRPGTKVTRKIPKIDMPVSDNCVLITFVGRMIWTKGVTYLYEAIRNIEKHRLTDAIYVLAGPGELEEELKDKIKKDGLEDKVLMTGDLQYEQVRDLLSVSDVFINPSHHNEGFPNTVLEGGSSGCYVIATDNAGTWEVVRNGETGALIPQRDTKAIENAILWALREPEKRKELAQRLRGELVERFDWDVISEQLYILLQASKKKG